MTAQTAYIGLGSNLASAAGDPYATLNAAINRLRALGKLVAQSSFYKTEPVGYKQQPPFVNAVAAVETEMQPFELLERLLAIERDFGRDRAQTPSKGPRTLDLDLLMVGDLKLNSPKLTLPHPALSERRFVLAPFAEIAPDTIHPLTGTTVGELLRELPDEGENRIAAVKIW
jgi:2-amino-4-hydroxy-6-hydroxymethyldihydropteridine diphosphokinase